MTKLHLKFADKVLKEIVLSQGVVTIGRLPDNLVHLDNPGVSGHHARISWENDHYVVEDMNSTNGTFLNSQPVRKAELKDGDVILVGKHSLEFRDRFGEESTGARKVVDRTVPWQKRLDETAPAKLDPTDLMDMERAQEMMAAGGRTSGCCQGSLFDGSEGWSTQGNRRKSGRSAVPASRQDDHHWQIGDGQHPVKGLVCS